MTARAEEGVSAETRASEAEQLLLERELAPATEAFREAERMGADPDRCSAGRWNAAMLSGAYEDAWRESDSIRRRGRPDEHRFWQGEAIEGRKLIVRSLHGLGDAIQMLRYAGPLRERAAQVIYEVPPRLVELASCFRDVDRVTTWGEDATRVWDWDVQLEMMELPYIFRSEVKDLPIARNYLQLPREMVQAVANSLGASSRPRVGVVWMCGEWNRARNVPRSLMERLFRQSGIEFWNLHGGSTDEESFDARLQESREAREGLLPLACLVANLDLVITPDTLAAHLAGALGKPAWVMLQYASDWRWMVDRADTPWYPSLRLFRQPRPGDWESVVDKVQRGLTECYR